MDFADWLRKQIEERGWEQAELARRMKVNSGSVANVLSRFRNAGPDFCLAVAHALRISPQDVFIARGWLPSRVEAETPLEKLTTLARLLSVSDQEILVRVAEGLIPTTTAELQLHQSESHAKVKTRNKT